MKNFNKRKKVNLLRYPQLIYQPAPVYPLTSNTDLMGLKNAENETKTVCVQSQKCAGT